MSIGRNDILYTASILAIIGVLIMIGVRAEERRLEMEQRCEEIKEQLQDDTYQHIKTHGETDFLTVWDYWDDQVDVDRNCFEEAVNEDTRMYYWSDGMNYGKIKLWNGEMS